MASEGLDLVAVAIFTFNPDTINSFPGSGIKGTKFSPDGKIIAGCGTWHMDRMT
jgi:hypothetical protein